MCELRSYFVARKCAFGESQEGFGLRLIHCGTDRNTKRSTSAWVLWYLTINFMRKTCSDLHQQCPCTRQRLRSWGWAGSKAGLEVRDLGVSAALTKVAFC